MIHFDTRCYCDAICSLNKLDCCPDAKITCSDELPEASKNISTGMNGDKIMDKSDVN